jgi:hypothetical protein
VTATTDPGRTQLLVERRDGTPLLALAGGVVAEVDGEVADLLAGATVDRAPATDEPVGTDGPGPRCRVTLDGRRLDRRGPAGRARAGLAVVRGTAVAADLSVRDHLAAVGGRRRADDALAGAPLLARRGGDPAGVLSGGERRVLGWIVARLLDPRAVLLDAAGAGLDAPSLAWAHATVDVWLDAGVAVAVRVGRVQERRWCTHRADGSPRHGTPRPGGPADVGAGRP